MRKHETWALLPALAVAVVLPRLAVAGAGNLRRPIQPEPPVPGMTPVETDLPATLGPMPRLDPIVRFVPPIDPWQPGGLGWDVEGLDDQGDPFCLTNRRPTPSCDPEGPRPFLHAGFDAAPAPDRVVHASAAGRVVIARHTTAFVTGLSQGEGGGIVVLEHDRDGDPATTGDHLLTIYGHVDPEVVVGQVVTGGERIALTSTQRGVHLHFAVRQGAFVSADLDVFRSFLPPAGTLGCAGCNSRPLPAPAFPDLFQDPAALFAPPPSLEHWLAIYGEPNDAATDVLETDDGALAFGYTNNQPGAPGRSMVARRLDSEGNVIAQRAYSGTGNDAFQRVQRTPDGGVIALAASDASTVNPVPRLLKFDPAGALLWSRRYFKEPVPGFPADAFWFEDLALTADGGFVVTGTIRPAPAGPDSVMAMRLDGAGNVLWVRSYFPQSNPRGANGRSVAPTPDGGFVILAQESFLANQNLLANDMAVLRIDANGGIVWATHPGNRLNDARPGQIAATSDGGAIVVGSRTYFSYFLPAALWVVRLNGDGTIAWNSLYGSASGNGVLDEAGTRLVITPDGGAVIASRRTDYRSDPFGPDTDLVLVRLDGAGEITGQRRLDSLGAITAPLGLRAATDGGYFVAGGVDADCRGCPFPRDGDSRFLVAHLDADLDCQGGCSAPYDFVRAPGPTPGAASGYNLGFTVASQVGASIAPVEATGARHLCGQGYFGAPPVFESTSVAPATRAVSCDRTEYAEGYVCSAGIPGSQATSPVILGVTYDALLLTTRVVDADSTPQASDVVSVTATFADSNHPPDPHAAVPVLDDGSLTGLPGFSNDSSYCAEDPAAGVCGCGPLHAPAYSGDAVIGDGIYSLEASLTLPNSLAIFDLGKGCIVESRPKSTLLSFSPNTPLTVIVRAIDRIGNVAATAATFTPAAASMSCGGDACGCCLLTSATPTLDCSGLPGMTTPDFPGGICNAF